MALKHSTPVSVERKSLLKAGVFFFFFQFHYSFTFLKDKECQGVLGMYKSSVMVSLRSHNSLTTGAYIWHVHLK